jgi:hypothetical protein
MDLFSLRDDDRDQPIESRLTALPQQVIFSNCIAGCPNPSGKAVNTTVITIH